METLKYQMLAGNSESKYKNTNFIRLNGEIYKTIQNNGDGKIIILTNKFSIRNVESQ
jgi:hypothetical protein